MNIFRHTKYFELPLALMLTPDKVDALIIFKRTALVTHQNLVRYSTNYRTSQKTPFVYYFFVCVLVDFV